MQRLLAITLVIAGTIGIASCAAEDEQAKAVDACVEKAAAGGTEEAAARTFCEAAIESQAAERAEQQAAADAEAAAQEEANEADSRPEQGVMPDVVDMDLQEAQDTLQAAGFDHRRSIDDTGRRRKQVIDSNWVVVSMSHTPGERARPADMITLFVVKDDEV